MVKLFRNSSFSQIVVILAAVVLLWGKAFIVPIAPERPCLYSPLYDLLYGWLSPLPRLGSAIALILVLFEGIWLNLLLFNHKMISNNSLMPLFIYLLAMSCGPDAQTITPMLFVNMTILAGYSLLFLDSADPLQSDRNFYAAACIGISSLFYLPSIALVVAYIGAFIAHKLYSWKHIMVALLGLAAPYIALLTVAYLNDRIDYTLFLMEYDIGSTEAKAHFETSLTSVANALVLLFIIFLTLRELSIQKEKMVHSRINTLVIIYPLLAAFVMAFYSQLFPFDIKSIALTFSFLTTSYFLAERRRKWVGETLLWTLILAMIIQNFKL